MEIVPVDNPKFGIYLYKNILPKELGIVERIEDLLEKNKEHDFFRWSEATIGYNEKRTDYRDCLDFKISDQIINDYGAKAPEIVTIYQDVCAGLRMCLDHYEPLFELRMEYMEAINFVKYYPDQYFDVHIDHGVTYSCVLSSVIYLNDDYKGGELYFPCLDITYQPECGDIILFPSTYIYAHASLPVTFGTKYAAVTMFDYNGRNHASHMPAAY
jgi:predicted 2-oxoglutarate/Fe(II)-dependent dioxygenase YbiX